ncbi:oxysterol-binding protein-related protein 8-like isoform X2 [Ostrea edulis]|uniref:oxysterol-binding protein-related protein 8-like isoform X2 n=1 Tax=Ostrea edulis TaxID=37623 RepID=UPI0024AE9CC6|nr:oxysterol-binding protein-related protein 8-like isoform X2 [Ostrea edulis]
MDVTELEVIYVEDIDWEDRSPRSAMPRHPSGDSNSSTPRKAPLNGQDSEHGDHSHCLHSSVSSPAFVFGQNRANSESKLFSPTGTPDKTSAKLSKRESLKVQKKNYRSQKKQAAKELQSTLTDSSVVVLADWLKVRGTLKSWTKLWCVLKPGLLVLYKSEKQKSSHWVGTVLLNTCRIIERPSKKDGFCFKLFHPLDQSIWATKGPKGETIGAIVQPLPYSYLIFRAMSESAGKCWMDALDLALRCTSLLVRSMKKDAESTHTAVDLSQDAMLTPQFPADHSEQMNESDCEKHFEGQGLDEDSKTDREELKTDTETESEEEEVKVFDDHGPPAETKYIENAKEELGQQGDSSQTEEVDDENKSLIWTLVKQVRPGMDLSKVVLPTFILEPRSFLDKLSDYYYHSDILSEAVLLDDPYARLKAVVRWYLSGFYKKPKGLKKPYNPIIGETFRCYWKHPKTNSRTFYIAEQISHHPPVSAFHITNRQDGFNISGSILAKSKFYGNSLSAILDGTAKLTFLKRGEDYLITMPYAHCKGILIGTLTMEMGGKISISCPKTGYKAEVDFKLKPFLNMGEASNKITGKLKVGTDTLATLEGHWDQEIYIKDKITGETHLFWSPTLEVRTQRLRRFTVPVDHQEDMESERLWKYVSDAVRISDMHAATQEKYILEERQRNEAKERKAKMLEWIPRLFERDPLTGDWMYKFVDMRPWDSSNDLLQYEQGYKIQTWTRHRTPVVRTCSITSLEQKPDTYPVRKIVSRNCSLKNKTLHVVEESESSTPEIENGRQDSDSSEPNKSRRTQKSSSRVRLSEEALGKAIQPLIKLQEETNESLKVIQTRLTLLSSRIEEQQQENLSIWPWLILIAAFVIQIFVQWFFR